MSERFCKWCKKVTSHEGHDHPANPADPVLWKCSICRRWWEATGPLRKDAEATEPRGASSFGSTVWNYPQADRAVLEAARKAASEQLNNAHAFITVELPRTIYGVVRVTRADETSACEHLMGTFDDLSQAMRLAELLMLGGGTEEVRVSVIARTA